MNGSHKCGYNFEQKKPDTKGTCFLISSNKVYKQAKLIHGVKIIITFGVGDGDS